MSAKVRKGDRVVVTTGREKGKKGEVLKVYPTEGRVLISGVNVIKKHQKQTQTQQGGIITKEGSIDLSNLALQDPKDGKPTRIGFKMLADGSKVRIARRSGEVIPEKK